MGKQIDKNLIYMSIISSYNIYRYTGETIKTHSSDNAYVLEHINSGEKFYCVKINTKIENISPEHFNIIVWHLANKSFFWFIDVIRGKSFDSISTDYYMVFPFVNLPNVASLAELSKQDQYFGLERPHIKNLVFNFIDAFTSLYSQNYMYVQWDDSNFFINNGRQLQNDSNMLYIAFSNAMKLVLPDGKIFDLQGPRVLESTVYTDPYVLSGGLYGWHSELYSFTTLLFRLLIGKLPYEGSLMDGIPNSNNEAMRHWVSEYLSHPIFIFDSNDTRNSIGEFKHEEIYLKRWNSLTPSIREMFCRVFVNRQVSSGNNTYFKAEEWKLQLNQFDFKLK